MCQILLYYYYVSDNVYFGNLYDINNVYFCQVYSLLCVVYFMVV